MSVEVGDDVVASNSLLDTGDGISVASGSRAFSSSNVLA